jgi:hypothetical protein
LSETFIEDSTAILSRTPAALNALLRGLPEAWLDATEGPGTWSPRFVVGHLIHGEKTDWMPRLRIILEHGTRRPFDAFDREGQAGAHSMVALLDEFAELRRKNLDDLRALALQPGQLALQGLHPELGPVSVRQLLATWTAHDLGHILQVSRVMAKRYKQDVGPWAQYLSVMRA